MSTAALSGADVAKVTVTVSGAGIAPDRVQDMVNVGGKWSGTISGIPAGVNRAFLADAFDSAGKVVYSGAAKGVTIELGKTASVLILLQQSTPPTPYKNGAPFIDALAASATVVKPGEVVALAVTAHDPDPGDTLAYNWSAPSGAFGTPAATATSWTAPAVDGVVELAVKVSDLHGASQTASLTITVASKGAAAVTVQFNTWPTVSSVSANPTRIDAGGSTRLTVAVTDADGDKLTFKWSGTAGDCSGKFSDPAAAAPIWYAPAKLPAAGACTLRVDVSDGRGGSTSGELTIQLAPPVAVTPMTCSTTLADNFDDGTVAPWTLVAGDVSIVAGRLRVVRTSSRWGEVVQTLSPALIGAWRVEVTMEMLTSQSLLALCLYDTKALHNYCLTLNNMTENGSSRGAHLYFDGLNGNTSTPLSSRLIDDPFDPGVGKSHVLELTRSASGDFELFVNGVSRGKVTHTAATRFDTIRLYGMQDTSGGHGGYFDNLTLQCAALGPPLVCKPTATKLKDFTVTNAGSVGASPPINGKIYILGGQQVFSFDPPYYANIWEYDTATDTTTDLGPKLPYALSELRRNSVAIGNNGKVYISPSLGPKRSNGWGSHRCLIEFDPVSKSAVERACFPSTRWAVRLVTAKSGLIYAFGGWNGGPIAEVWTYDAKANTLVNTGATTSMSGEKIIESILGPDGLIYHLDAKSIGAFDPATNSFKVLAPHGMASPGKAWVGKDGLIHGFGAAGATPKMYDSTFTFDPKTAKTTITMLTSPAFARTGGFESVDTVNGHFYLFAGHTNSTPVTTVERTDCLPGL